MKCADIMKANFVAAFSVISTTFQPKISTKYYRIYFCQT